MARTDSLLAEFVHETSTARRHVEQLRTEQLGWRPHAKSFTAGELASHMIECIRWVERIFGADAFDMDPIAYAPIDAKSVPALLATFDEEVAKAKWVMASAADTDATQLWRLRVRGKVRFERPREAAFRDMTLNHLIHHRGQFSVYLRLLDLPVPGSYGPTADDRK